MKNKFSFIMKCAALVTMLLTVALTAAYHILPLDWMRSAAISFGTTAYHLVMRLAVGYSIPRLTNYDFDYRHRWFQVRQWEPFFYKKLRNL